MFTDYAKILIKSGDGGDGAITFRREKYVASRADQMVEMVEMVAVYILLQTQILILLQILDIRENLKLKMEKMVQVVIDMESLGEDLYIKVPRGTVVKNAETRKSYG